MKLTCITAVYNAVAAENRERLIRCVESVATLASARASIAAAAARRFQSDAIVKEICNVYDKCLIRAT